MSTQMRERAKAAFAPVYLTLLSVIQAGAFGYLLVLLDAHWSRLTPESTVALLTTVLIIITTWHEYVMGAIAFKWVPRLLDSLIPFCIGITECLVARQAFVRGAMWFYFLSFYCLVGYVAYWNMFRRAGAELENQDALGLLGRFPAVTKVWTLAYVGLFIGLGIIRTSCFSEVVQLLALGVSLVSFIAFLARGVIYWGRLVDA